MNKKKICDSCFKEKLITEIDLKKSDYHYSFCLDCAEKINNIELGMEKCNACGKKIESSNYFKCWNSELCPQTINIIKQFVKEKGGKANNQPFICGYSTFEKKGCFEELKKKSYFNSKIVEKELENAIALTRKQEIERNRERETKKISDTVPSHHLSDNFGLIAIMLGIIGGLVFYIWFIIKKTK